MEKIKSIFRILRYIHLSIYINFKYLPFKTAIKLPILLYKTRFGKLQGSIQILTSAENIKFGMIQLGFPANLMYPNNGMFFEIAGNGKLIFRGEAFLGNGCAISVGGKGILDLGCACNLRTNVRICAYHYVRIGEKTHIAWNTLIMDTSFHTMKDAITKKKLTTKPYGPIIIGKSNWIGSNSTILKNSYLEDFSVLAGGSILSKNLHSPKNCILGGNPVHVLKEGVYRDMDDCSVEYEWYREDE